MESGWQRKKILIWGKTRPELSQKYREIVCTGGVFEDTRRLVRLYPIPLRYMNDERVFRKYQWIEACVAKSSSDPRPESYKIRSDDIRTLDTIPTVNGNWDERAKWIITPENVFQSVEALQARQQIDRTSLGLIKPSIIKEISANRNSDQYRKEFLEKYRNVLSQMELPLDPETGRAIKPLTPPDYRFQIRFACDDVRCQVDHVFSILDWETDALYFKLKSQGASNYEAANKVVDHLKKETDIEKIDVHFFIGNIASHPQTFTIVGLWRARIQKSPEQISLF